MRVWRRNFTLSGPGQWGAGHPYADGLIVRVMSMPTARMRWACSSEPKAEFPYMTETARHARSVDADKELFGGLAVLLRGLDE